MQWCDNFFMNMNKRENVDYKDLNAIGLEKYIIIF